ncbi:TetR/AcrR family transcriptional regulator [Gemmatimonadota bacterium]
MMRPFTMPGLRERKDAEVKRAFFEAAMELFREKGFDGTSVDEIAAKVGYSRATFFNHFGSKSGVFRYYGHILAQRVGKLLDGVDPALSPLERIRQILLSMAREADARREDLKVVFVHSVNDPDYLMGPTAARKQIAETVTALMRESQDQELVRTDLPARELAFHTLSLYHSAVLALVWDLADAETAMKSAWRFLLTGVTGERPATG